MPEPPDMNAPVTHAQLHAALEIWGGALLDRMGRIATEARAMEQRLAAEARAMEQRLAADVRATEQRLLTEMAGHANANRESVSAEVAVVDEKYTDLPPRVSRLERSVFKRRR